MAGPRRRRRRRRAAPHQGRGAAAKAGGEPRAHRSVYSSGRPQDKDGDAEEHRVPAARACGAVDAILAQDDLAVVVEVDLEAYRGVDRAGGVGGAYGPNRRISPSMIRSDPRRPRMVCTVSGTDAPAVGTSSTVPAPHTQSPCVRIHHVIGASSSPTSSTHVPSRSMRSPSGPRTSCGAQPGGRPLTAASDGLAEGRTDGEGEVGGEQPHTRIRTAAAEEGGQPLAHRSDLLVALAAGRAAAGRRSRGRRIEARARRAHGPPEG